MDYWNFSCLHALKFSSMDRKIINPFNYVEQLATRDPVSCQCSHESPLIYATLVTIVKGSITGPDSGTS